MACFPATPRNSPSSNRVLTVGITASCVSPSIYTHSCVHATPATAYMLHHILNTKVTNTDGRACSVRSLVVYSFGPIVLFLLALIYIHYKPPAKKIMRHKNPFFTQSDRRSPTPYPCMLGGIFLRCLPIQSAIGMRGIKKNWTT